MDPQFCDLDDRSFLEREAQDGLGEAVVHAIVDYVDKIVGVQVANAPDVGDCTVPSRPEGQVIADTINSLPTPAAPAKTVAKFVGKKLGLKRIGQFILETGIKPVIEELNGELFGRD